MGKGRPNKRINEDFFKEESKEMLYLLGISFSKYHCQKRYNKYPICVWQSSNREIIEKVKRLLRSEHKIQGPIKYKNIRKEGKSFSVYMLRIQNQKLKNDLIRYGLGKPKKERIFPDIKNKDHIDDFIRGFLDAQTKGAVYKRMQIFYRSKKRERIFKYRYIYKKLSIHFNEAFNSDLEKILLKKADITPVVHKGSNLVYQGENIQNLYDFIYGDRRYIEKHDLYLPNKKQRFEA